MFTDSSQNLYNRIKVLQTELLLTESGQPGQRDGQKQAIITITLEVLRVVLLRNMAGRNLSAPVANSLAGCILIPREIIIRISGLPQVIILNHQESLQAV